MKKSDLKLLQANMQKALLPPQKPKPDLSDELSNLFDDGTPLPGERQTPSPANTASLETIASLAKSASQEDIASQENIARLANSARLANQDTAVRQIASLAEFASQAKSATQVAEPQPDILASLPEVKGFLKLYYQLVDHLMPQLTPPEAVVYLHLYRLSHGFGNPTCTISNPGIARRTKMSKRSVQDVTTRLQTMGLIQKVGQIIGAGKEQGIEWRVAIPAGLAKSARLAKFATNIDSVVYKENTQTQEPAAGVRVGSRFKIEECRKYAEHLRSTGEGITNPGGYATTIHRTGEADELIERFLNPSSVMQVDASACPDCQGSGFYYPNGPTGGVAKCKHTRLPAGKGSLS